MAGIWVAVVRLIILRGLVSRPEDVIQYLIEHCVKVELVLACGLRACMRRLSGG